MPVGVQPINQIQLKAHLLDDKNNKIFFIEEGTYQLNETLVINEPNVTLVGIGEVTLVKHKDVDGIYVSEGGEGFCMFNIKIIDQGANDSTNGICLVVKANNTFIQDCYFERSVRQLSVCFPGPDHRRKYTNQNLPTALDCYFNVTYNHIHQQNVFRNNIVRSKLHCDSLSLSLQQACVENNDIEGRVNVYMCKNILISENRIQNKSKEGEPPLSITLPAENITIRGNEFFAQSEQNIHISGDKIENKFKDAENITIRGNELVSQFEQSIIRIDKPDRNDYTKNWAEFVKKINDGVQITVVDNVYKPKNAQLIDRAYPLLKKFPDKIHEINSQPCHEDVGVLREEHQNIPRVVDFEDVFNDPRAIHINDKTEAYFEVLTKVS